jgi:nitroreductase/NAD-dependent dihydropyrimidine dehydrogenase PreA subunit
MNNTIDPEVCSSCKLCIEVCPCKVVGINDNNNVHFIRERESICLQCGQCMAVCTTKAITVKGLSYDDLFDLTENNMDYNSFLAFLANRRSIRNFRDKPVSEEILLKILDSISYAPFGAEPEKVHITIINNRKIIETALPFISGFLDDIVKWLDNPVASFFIKSRRGPETFNTIKNHLYPISKSGNYKLALGDRITRGAPALIIFHAEKGAEEHTNNAVIYATYSILAAHSLGLGATMIGIVPAAINKVPEVRDIFQIPKENEAVMSFILGYPKYRYKRAIKRKQHNINWIN